MRLGAESIYSHRIQDFGEATLYLGEHNVQTSQFKELSKLLIGSSDATVLFVVDILSVEIGAHVLLDDNEATFGEVILAAFEIFYQLGVRKVAHAPLVPDQVVLVGGIQGPVLQADVGDAADTTSFDELLAAFGLLQLLGELVHRLNNVHGLGDLQQEAKGDSSNAGAAVGNMGQQLVGLSAGNAAQLVVEVGGALEVYARDLRKAAEHAIDGRLDGVPVVD